MRVDLRRLADEAEVEDLLDVRARVLLGALNLARFDHLKWMTTDKPIWFIAEYLCEIPHISLLTPAMEKNLTRLDRRTMSGEMVGHRKK